MTIQHHHCLQIPIIYASSYAHLQYIYNLLLHQCLMLHPITTHPSMHIHTLSFTLLGGSSFVNTLVHVRMSRCLGIDTSFSRRVMDNLKRGHSYERTLHQLLLDFTLKCRRYNNVNMQHVCYDYNCKVAIPSYCP